MKPISFLFYLVYFIFLSPILLAQTQSNLYFMPDVVQSRHLNPALKNNFKTNIGIFSTMYLKANNSGFNLNHLIQQKNDSTIIKFQQLRNEMSDENHLDVNFNTDLLFFSFNIGDKVNFMVNSSLKFYKRLIYPGNLINFISEDENNVWIDNPDFNPALSSSLYNEIGVGFSYEVSKKFTVGSRFKYMIGIANANSTANDFTINQVNQDISLKGNGSLYLAGVSEDFKIINGNGLAIDLGFTYMPHERMTIGLSMVDIGSIRWKNNTTAYLYDADIVTSGFPLSQIINGNSELFDQEIEQIEEGFNHDKVEGVNYKTLLPRRLYLSYSYEIKNNFFTNLLFIHESFMNRPISGLSINIQKNFGRTLGLSLAFNRMNRQSTFGGGLTLNLGFSQMYLISDNLFNIVLSDPILYNTRNASVRIGSNLVFGNRNNNKKR